MATIKVTGNQIMEALDALRHILGINEGDKKARFSFKPKNKILLAKKLKMLNEEGKDLDDHRKDLIQELGISGALDTTGKNIEDTTIINTFTKRWGAFMDAEQELEIGMIEESALEMGTDEAPKNDIAGGFLAALDWLIQWSDEVKS